MVVIYLLTAKRAHTLSFYLRRATADESGVERGFSYVVTVGDPTEEAF